MLAEFTLAVIAFEGGNGGLLDVNPGLMIWTVVTFIVLLLILKKVAWKPILSKRVDTRSPSDLFIWQPNVKR